MANGPTCGQECAKRSQEGPRAKRDHDVLIQEDGRSTDGAWDNLEGDGIGAGVVKAG